MANERLFYPCNFCDSFLEHLRALETHIMYFHTISLDTYRKTYPGYNEKVAMIIQEKVDEGKEEDDKEERIKDVPRTGEGTVNEETQTLGQPGMGKKIHQFGQRKRLRPSISEENRLGIKDRKMSQQIEVTKRSVIQPSLRLLTAARPRSPSELPGLASSSSRKADSASSRCPCSR